MLVDIESEIVQSLDFRDIIDSFSSIKSRRQDILCNNTQCHRLKVGLHGWTASAATNTSI